MILLRYVGDEGFLFCVFFFQAEDGIRDDLVTGVQTCALPISLARLFKLFKDKVECVLLNACYSEVQAAAIHQHVEIGRASCRERV